MTDEPMTEQTPDRVIGRASATERQANTADKFHFWLRPHEQVNPFDIVDAEHLDASHTYGLVTDIHHSTDAPAHLSNYIANDFGELVDDPNTPRQGANVCEVSVMANSGEIDTPVETESLVRFADEDGIHRGLGIEIMKEKEDEGNRPVRVPAGLIQMSNGVTAGPPSGYRLPRWPRGGARQRWAGISGLATKTSYVNVLPSVSCSISSCPRRRTPQGAPRRCRRHVSSTSSTTIFSRSMRKPTRYPRRRPRYVGCDGLLQAQPFP